jgi:hypothetical protein
MKKIMALFVDISIDWKRFAKHCFMEGIKPMHITIDNLLKFDYNQTKVDCIIFDYSFYRCLSLDTWRTISEYNNEVEFMPRNIPRILWTSYTKERYILRPQDWFVEKEVICPKLKKDFETRRVGIESPTYYTQFTDVYQTPLSPITHAIKMACNTHDSI